MLGLRWCCVLVLVLVALLCSVPTVTAQQVINVNTVPWWKRAIFYQVYPRSFRDSNGDGVGDLKGVAEKAQYFKDIGVDAIWLSPFFTSPMRDFGYDISNYTGIDPLFGNMDDFRNLTYALQKVGVKLVIDFVPNHSSDLHPWFQLSCNRTKDYTDYYVWDDGLPGPDGKPVPPNNWMSVFGGSAWEWHEGRGQFYYHAFLKEQPDLNFNNQATRDAMEEVIKYWLDIGVDGFRLDSANYMFESDNRYANETPIPGTDGKHWKDYVHNLTQNQNKTYQMFDNWAMYFYNYTNEKVGKPRALFLEVYTDLNNTMRYYGTGNTSLMLPFNFELLVHANQSSRSGWLKELIDTWLDNMPDDGVANWVVGNHDNGRVADRYGFELVDAINMLTGVLPGIKVTYYGAELGMRDTFIRWDQNVDPSGTSLGPYHYLEASRDPERTPMQWDGSISAGFSNNKTTWLPVNPNYWWLNVQRQMSADRSHLKVFKALAKARRDPVLLAGNCTVLAPDNDTLVVVRNWNESYFVLLINLGSEFRVYSAMDLSLPVNLTFDMQVNVTSMNVEEHNIGDRLLGNNLTVQMRPKAAILLKSIPSSSSGMRCLLSLPLLLGVVSRILWR